MFIYLPITPLYKGYILFIALDQFILVNGVRQLLSRDLFPILNFTLDLLSDLGRVTALVYAARVPLVICL